MLIFFLPFRLGRHIDVRSRFGDCDFAELFVVCLFGLSCLFVCVWFRVDISIRISILVCGLFLTSKCSWLIFCYASTSASNGALTVGANAVAGLTAIGLVALAL